MVYGQGKRDGVCAVVDLSNLSSMYISPRNRSCIGDVAISGPGRWEEGRWSSAASISLAVVALFQEVVRGSGPEDRILELLQTLIRRADGNESREASLAVNSADPPRWRGKNGACLLSAGSVGNRAI